MQHNDQNKYRLIAAAVTLLIAVLTVVVLFLFRLHFDSGDKPTWPPENESEIIAAEQFYEVLPQPILPGGSNEPDDGSAPPPPDAQDMINAGTPAPEVTPLVTADKPSPMKQEVKKPVQPTGPSQAEIEDQRAKEQREKEATANAQNAVKNVFGNTPASQGSGTGEAGNGQGAANSSGRYRGGYGSGNADGRKVTIPSFRVPGDGPGTMVVEAYYDRKGNLLSSPAPVVKSKTGICSNSEVSEMCMAKVRQSHLTPKEDAPERQKATITFNIN